MTCLNLNCRILPPLWPLQCTAADVSAQVLLLILILYAVFLWVVLNLHHSVASDLGRSFDQTPGAGKASALGPGSAWGLGKTKLTQVPPLLWDFALHGAPRVPTPMPIIPQAPGCMWRAGQTHHSSHSQGLHPPSPILFWAGPLLQFPGIATST